MPRLLQPELLDSLPPDHPDALHNRRDLRLTNAITGSHRWLVRTLREELRTGERALELGAGTGELGLRFARAGVPCDGLDLWPRPASWPPGCAWHRADLVTFSNYAPYAAVVGNLIFHQFDDPTLARLGARIRSAGTRLVIACEPERRRASQVLFGLFAFVTRANHVSRHDARVSIDAGFRDRELADALGLDAATWDVRRDVTLFGLHRLIARRRA